MNQTISFIGAGNMARSLIAGLLADGYPASQIRAADPSAEQREALSEQFGISVSADNREAVSGADLWLLAVKPQQLRVVSTELAPVAAAADPLLVSIAAGVTEPAIRSWLGYPAALVRCMPNTPALLQCGATALYANPQVSAEQRQAAERVLAAAGLTLWVDDETLLDAVTAVSGSGPAYFFLLMEAMEQAGEKLGLSAEQARQLTLQTALGAARMALEAGEPPAELRRRVTSPGGTTERAVTIFQAGGFAALCEQALNGAAERCRELSAELGGEV